jgi:hypothetical protein
VLSHPSVSPAYTPCTALEITGHNRLSGKCMDPVIAATAMISTLQTLDCSRLFVVLLQGTAAGAARTSSR